MKVGIITRLYNSNNYGGCLQAYALERILINYGFSAKQILYKSSKNKAGIIGAIRSEYKSSGLVCLVRKVIMTLIQRTKGHYYRLINRIMKIDEVTAARVSEFKRFRECIIDCTDRVYDSSTIYECNDYDAYITGSDEVWRIFGNSLNPAYWLLFVPSNKIKISYAASLSMVEIPNSIRDSVKIALSDYTGISVRQNTDKECISKLANRPVEWVLDPTLLLDVKEWESISEKNNYRSEKYIFTYLLGDNSNQRKLIVGFAKENGLKIINIPYLHNQYQANDRWFGDYRISDVSPELWISLIKDAEYVFTDSFHGAVFSLMFHKRLFAFLRDNDNSINSRNSRIYSLFELFKISNRIIKSDFTLNDLMIMDEIDYTIVEDILKRERAHSIDFLLGALNQDES